MSTEPLFLIGAGGHGLVVLDAIERAEGASEGISIFDQSENRIGQKALDLIVHRFDSAMNMKGRRFHICIGDNATRARLFCLLAGAGGIPATVIHPIATIAPSALVGSGSFIAAHGIVAPDALLGEGVIINHGTIVDHECIVGSFCHIAPGATLAGNARVGDRVMVGAGANILPGRRIGDDAIIGAGAVVTTDVPPGATYVGVPARQIR
ncbi:acetyltransferase [Bradyrhizobium sp. 149]|uniref:acetyltransferase n=1 Tax=Bradyrhizobium sp. 149 TaxID=2782624 RepID=UPI001FF7D454|nr:acetyltransferase [Bradyrhizobium sp. 149]MCK1652705.1 acetyltransferase [Bradyrhizobium sp. 149]